MSDIKLLFALKGYKPYKSNKGITVWLLVRKDDNEHIFMDSSGTMGRTNHPVNNLVQAQWNDIPVSVVERLSVLMK